MDKRALLLPLTLMVLACATTGGTSPRRSSNVLLSDEIAGVTAQNIYEAVQQTRPQWLRTRASPSMGNRSPVSATVYLDGVRLGGLDELRRLRPQIVDRLEFMSPSDATNRFGTNHTGGAILITTR